MILYRTYYENYTLGYLFVDWSTVVHTMEPPWKDNERNKSCIPAGSYTLSYLEHSASGKYHRVYHVQQVPGRAGILIHTGNLVTHTRGCILPGLRTGMIGKEVAVLSSKLAMNKIIAAKPEHLYIIN